MNGRPSAWNERPFRVPQGDTFTQKHGSARRVLTMPHMPIHKTLPIVSLFLVFTLSPARAADDWPQWRGPDRTGHVPAGVPVPSTLPSQPKVLWHVPVGF